MKTHIKVAAADLFLIGAVAGFAASSKATFWLSWRRVRRQVGRLGVGELPR